MRVSNLAATFVVLLLVFASQPVPAQDRAAFEKALLLEEVQAQYQEAISAYQEIVNDSADPAVAAQAQLHIGMCYEKLGLEKASLAYQKVIDDYPTQTETVVKAKEKLSRLNTKPEESGSATKDLQLQQVWADPFDTMGTPSPDGRFMSYVHWNVPCLAIYEFETGKSSDITSTTGTWDNDAIWPESPLWSPDGKNLAYVWYGKEYISIRVVGIDSSQPIEVFGDKNLNYCHPHGWSADGKHILAVLCHKDRTHDIVLISIDDHSVRKLKHLEAGYHPLVSLSPDGQFVAYSFPHDMNSRTTDIYTFSTIDGTERTLVDHPATDFNPMWMPDGKHIVFFSDRTGTVSLWSLKVTDGAADGEEKLIKNLNPLSPKTILPNGDLYLTFLEGGFDVYSAIVDPQSAKLESPPERVVETNIGWNAGPCFSPDGKTMAYVSQRGVLNPEFAWGQQSLVLRDLQTAEERELVPRSRQLMSGRSPLKWSPDSDEVLLVGRDETGMLGAFILNTQDGSFESLTGEKRFDGADVLWGKNSDTVYYYMFGDTERNGIYSIDRKSHTITKIISENNIQGFALRPGKDELTIIANNVIQILNLENKELKNFFELGPDVKHSYFQWSPDGQWLYLMKCLGEKSPEGKKTVQLWRIDAQGENAQLVAKSLPHMRNFSMDPDGKTLAFTAVENGPKASIWVMKNFLD